LGLVEVDKERIIRILGYLGLLDNDLSVFDKLPKDALRLIGLRLDCRSLGLFCQISSNFNKTFCLSGELTEMLRIKLQETTRLDLTGYTKTELGLLCRIGERRNILAAGAGQSLVLNSRGQVYSFGTDAFGSLGHGRRNSLSSPTLIEIFENGQIISISAGEHHSLLLNNQGQVFEFGTKGLGKRSQVPDLSIRHLEANPAIGETVSISAGGHHTLICNSQGQAYASGGNSFGQLGLGDFEKRLFPTLITTPMGKIVTVSAGNFHSLFLNSQGRVFSCGENAYGSLGLGHENIVSIPTLIEESEDIVAISAGGFHSLLLNSQGQVFSFGYGVMGQLGHGNTKNQLIPVLIDEPEIGQIVTISAGEKHSLILNSQGQVFSFGYGDFGQLGLGTRENQSSPTLIEIDDIIAISAGTAHSLIANAQGQVFSFGFNRGHQLGFFDDRNRLTPSLIGGLHL
jgi:alpha-tubulin suppressor-like RCC1 family protein